MSYQHVLHAVNMFHDQLTALRRDIHANPELGFEETRTAALVARMLRSLGYEVHTGIGRTGVVAVLEGRTNTSGRSIGLRADMDALPIHETADLPYRSRSDGIMHACGHDGHTAILLGAARYLAETRNFDGRVVLILDRKSVV